MNRKTLIDFFEEVETTEEYSGYFCSIAEAIGIVVLGSLCGFKNVSQIHQWAENERVQEFLKEKFGIKHIPCYYWLLVLLKMVKTDSLNQCLMKWAAQYLPEDRRDTTISIDGKTIRSTAGMKNMSSPLHIISAQICELGITLASETVDSKTNEIPTVQSLIEKMDIEGCLIVADALNCQQKTADVIISGKGDYLLDAKGNQRSLEEEIAGYVQDPALRKSMDSVRQTEKNRDRIETRTAYVTDDINWLYGKEKWKDLNCIGAIKAEFEKNGVKSEQWHYYISSRKLSAMELLRHDRMEWTVETMHWLLDVHYGEDYCRVENRTIQQNLNLLRKFSLSLIKQYKNKGFVRRVVPPYEMSVEDFDIWKKKLVDDALEQRRHDDRTTRNDVSIENLLETDLVATESIADELIREEEERQAYNKKIRQARELLDCLTEKQRQRYIKTMAYQKNNRTIAEEEGCSHQMISKSVSKAQEIIDEEKKKRGY